jgi:SAM-dependent methyltransferase
LRRARLPTPRDDHARVAYDALAPGYDDLTRGHDHAAWTSLLEARAFDAGLAGSRLLDVACGTGNTILPMLERGYDVTGVDVSEAMLAEAERKSGGAARLVVGDMRRLPVLGEFDLIWCLGDALNYLDSEAELTAALTGMRLNLAPDGVVVIDVNTLATFRTLYSSVIAVPADERIVLLEGHGSRALAAGGRADTWIDRLEPQNAGGWRRSRSVHHHRHHVRERVLSALARSGLECVSICGTELTGVTHTPLDDLHHAKAVYTARRGALHD